MAKLKGYLVLNEKRTQGFFTTDEQLAYEIRKGSDSNCFDEYGEFCKGGAAFTIQFTDDNLTTSVIEVEVKNG